MVRHQSDEGGETERLGLVGVCLLQQHRRHPFNEFGSAHKVPVHFIQVSELGEVIVNISLQKSQGEIKQENQEIAQEQESQTCPPKIAKREAFFFFEAANRADFEAGHSSEKMRLDP